jgi:hypothetical protein
VLTLSNHSAGICNKGQIEHKYVCYLPTSNSVNDIRGKPHAQTRSVAWSPKAYHGSSVQRPILTSSLGLAGETRTVADILGSATKSQLTAHKDIFHKHIMLTQQKSKSTCACASPTSLALACTFPRHVRPRESEHVLIIRSSCVDISAM